MFERFTIERLLTDFKIHKKQPYTLYLRKGNKEIYDTVGDFDCEGKYLNFRLASVSKQIIAYAIINLINKQKLSFDTILFDLFERMPEFTKKITVFNLLNHTSGLLDYEDKPHQESDPQIQDDDVLEFVRGTSSTYFEPGKNYRYSNTAYVLLGLVIKKLSNVSIDDYLQENVFKPAGMVDTRVNYEPNTKINNRVYGNILKDGEIVQKDQYWCSATIGDGGLYSNINDLKNWIKFIRDEKYEELKDTMFKPNILPNGDNTCYGMGIRIIEKNNKTFYYHCGSTIGTNTLLFFSKDKDIEFILLTNMDSCDTAKVKDNILKYIVK